MIPDNIRALVEDRFGKKIAYSKDCEILSRSIEKVCEGKISPTTLKRLFGFAKNIDKPRLFTLDVLATYVGFSDWCSLLAKMDQANIFPPNKLDFRQNSLKDNIHLLHHQIAISLTVQHINTNAIILLCRKFGDRPEIFPFLTEMISIAANHKNIQFLKQIFSLPVIFTAKVHNSLGYYYIGQTFGFMMRHHKDISYELINVLASNTNAQKYFIEWFVDEDYLQDYYGHLLDAYYQKSKKSAEIKLFYFCLKCKQSLQAGDLVQHSKWYKKLKKISITTVMHQIPIGRYTGICISEDPSHFFHKASPYYLIIQNIIYKKEYDIALGFMLYLCRELFSSQRKDWLILIFTEFEDYHGKWELYKKSKDHWGIKIENQLLIYAAYVTYLKGDFKKAKFQFEKIDPNLFEPFIYQHINNDYLKVEKILNQ